MRSDEHSHVVCATVWKQQNNVKIRPEKCLSKI